MNKIMANGIINTQPQFSVMQVGNSCTSVCKGSIKSIQTKNKEEPDIFPFICFDEIACYVKDNCNESDGVVLYGYLKNYKYTLRNKEVHTHILVVTEIVNADGENIVNTKTDEEGMYEEMVEKEYPLMDQITKNNI